MALKGSKTEHSLKEAFAGESRRTSLSVFAAKADVEGYNDVAAVFRSTAEGETATRTPPRVPRAGRRSGHRMRSAALADNLRASIAGEPTSTPHVPGHGEDARDEASTRSDWFETLAKAERSTPTASRRRSTARG